MNTPVDPVTLSVVDQALQDIVDEMDIALESTAFSPVISEGGDRTSGLYDHRDAGVVAQGHRGLPLFLTSMQFTVAACKEAFPDLQPGDIVAVNDPYVGGTHMQDMKLCAAVWHGGQPFMYLANAGHWADIGGSAHGGYSLRATDVHKEGLRVPPVLIARGGTLDRSVMDLIMANVRLPEMSRGDLLAQVAALRVGERRITELLDRYGRDTVRACIDEMRSRSESMMKALIAQIPPGRYEFENHLDNDGVVDEPLTARVTITVDADHLTCDFAGSSPTSAGPMNASYANTHSGVFVALKHAFPEVPFNAGAFTPVKVAVPEGSFLDARYPQPGSGCSGEVAALIVNVVFGALATALPERVPAGTYYSMGAVTIGGSDPEHERAYVMATFNGGGYGAYRSADGLTHVPGSVGNGPMAPVEIMEHFYPVLYRRFALRSDSGGPGRFRGGLGTEAEIVLRRGAARVALLADNGRYPPTGLDSGAAGAPTEALFRRGGREEPPAMLTKADDEPLAEGDSIVLRTPGGGGWGDPLDRDPRQVQQDVVTGYVSPAAALECYGVVIDPDGGLDEAATRRQRDRLRAADTPG